MLWGNIQNLITLGIKDTLPQLSSGLSRDCSLLQRNKSPNHSIITEKSQGATNIIYFTLFSYRGENWDTDPVLHYSTSLLVDDSNPKLLTIRFPSPLPLIPNHQQELSRNYFHTQNYFFDGATGKLYIHHSCYLISTLNKENKTGVEKINFLLWIMFSVLRPHSFPRLGTMRFPEFPRRNEGL